MYNPIIPTDLLIRINIRQKSEVENFGKIGYP